MTVGLARTPATPFAWLPPSLWALRRDAVFIGLVAILVVLTLATPHAARHYSARVDWPTIAALGGLLLLTRGVEASGALQWAGRRLVDHAHTERSVALGLVGAAAVLAMFVTNDVALFIVVPLTLDVCRIARLPAARLVILEALAVNVGSALTPIGNPQNIFLWQCSGVAFGRFVAAMAPLVGILALFLLVLTVSAFGRRRVVADHETPVAPIDPPLLVVSLALYAPFLVLADHHLVGWGLAAVALAFGALRPRLVRDVDWGLLVVFVLMFIDLRTLADLAIVHRLFARLDLAAAAPLYATGILASQLVSNVPATIALAEYAHDWRVLAWGVNVGGFGLAIGSLANLIALRMLREPGAWRRFHAWSLPFLAVAAAAGYALLAVGG